MTITLIKKPTFLPREVSGCQTSLGKAYRLVQPRADTNARHIGDIYIACTHMLMNLDVPGHRTKHTDDIYVEVDLEITVKEKY